MDLLQENLKFSLPSQISCTDTKDIWVSAYYYLHVPQRNEIFPKYVDFIKAEKESYPCVTKLYILNR
jgi:hypothetical protein